MEICMCVNVMKTCNVRWRFIVTFLNIWQRNVVYNQRLGVQRVKANIIKIIFCCYHVQISLTMSQQTQSDIFHTKMLQNALWCQITWSKCMLCNIYTILLCCPCYMPKYVPRLEGIMHEPKRGVHYAFQTWDIFRHITWTTQYYCYYSSECL